MKSITEQSMIEILEKEPNPLEALFKIEISNDLQMDLFSEIGKCINGKYDFAKMKKFATQLLEGKVYKLKPTPEIIRLIVDGLTHHFTIEQQKSPRTGEELVGVFHIIETLSRLNGDNHIAKTYRFHQNQALTRAMFYFLKNDFLPTDKIALNQVRQTFVGIDINQNNFPCPVFSAAGNFNANATEDNTQTQGLFEILLDNNKLDKEKLLFLYGCGFEFKDEHKAALLSKNIELDEESKHLLFGNRTYQNANEFLTELANLDAIKFFDEKELRKKIIQHSNGQITEETDLLEYFKQQQLPTKIFVTLMEKGIRPKNEDDAIKSLFSRMPDFYSSEDQITMLNSAYEIYKDSEDQTFLRGKLMGLERSIANTTAMELLNARLNQTASKDSNFSLERRAALSDPKYFDKLIAAIENFDHELVGLFLKTGFFNYNYRSNDNSRSSNSNFFKLLSVVTTKLGNLIAQETITKEDQELYAQLIPNLKVWSEHKDLSSDLKQDIILLIESCSHVFNQHSFFPKQNRTGLRIPNDKEAELIITFATSQNSPHLALGNYLKINNLDLNASAFQNLGGFDAKNDCLKCLLIHYPNKITPKILATLLSNGLDVTPNHIHLANQTLAIKQEALDMLLYARNPKLLIQRIKETVIFSNDSSSFASFSLISNNISAIKNSPEHHDDLILFLLKHRASPNYINLLLNNGITPKKHETLFSIALYKDDYEAKYHDQKELFAKLKPEDLEIQTIIDRHKTNSKHIGELAEFCADSHSFLEYQSDVSKVVCDGIKALLDKKDKSGRKIFLPLEDDFVKLFSYSIENNYPVFFQAVKRWIGDNSKSLSSEAGKDREKLRIASEKSIPILATKILEFDNFEGEPSPTQIKRKDARQYIASRMKELSVFLQVEEKISQQLDQDQGMEAGNKKIFKQFINEIKKGKSADIELIKKLLTEKPGVVEAEFAKDFGANACVIDILLKHEFPLKLIEAIIDNSNIKPKISITNALRHEETYTKLGADLLNFLDLLSKFNGSPEERELLKHKKAETEKNIIKIIEQSLLHKLENIGDHYFSTQDNKIIEGELGMVTQIIKKEADLFEDDESKQKYKTSLENLMVLSASMSSKDLFKAASDLYKQRFTPEDFVSIASKTADEMLRRFEQNQTLFNEDRTEYHSDKNKIDFVRTEKHHDFLKMISAENPALEQKIKDITDGVNRITQEAEKQIYSEDDTRKLRQLQLMEEQQSKTETPRPSSTPKTNRLLERLKSTSSKLLKATSQGRGGRGDQDDQ